MTGPSPVRNVEFPGGTLLEKLAQRAAEAPDRAAVLAPGAPPLSFHDLHRRVEAIADGLRRFGLRAGDVVAICMPDGPELLAAMLGGMQNTAAAPLDWKFTEAELKSRLALLPSRCLWIATGAESHPAAAAAAALGIPVIQSRFSPDGTAAFFVVDGTSPGPRPSQDGAPAEVALILTTSATTGVPKLVPLTRANVEAICENTQTGLPFDSQDRYLGLMPFHHVLGFACAAAQLAAGGSVVSTSGFDAAKLLTWLQEFEPSWYTAGPTLQRAILEIARQNRHAFRNTALRFTRSGSGASSPALLDELEEVLGVTVINGYGLTEVGPATSTREDRPRKPNSVGKACGLEIAILKTQPGEEGEIVMRGPSVMHGYLNDSAANRESFQDGWFRTGDLGRLDAGGDLFITGRIKEIINRGGETIAPLEIDHALMEHPAIAHAACFPVAHPTLVEDVAAAVVLRPGASVSADQIRGFLSSRLSAAKVPARILFVDSIPVSASGKPLRQSLTERLETNLENPAAPLSQWTPLEQVVAEVWTSVLPAAPSTPDDDFFALGGDSLSAARMLALLDARIGLDTSLRERHEVFAGPTVANLARVAADALSEQDSVSLAPRRQEFEDVTATCLQARGSAPPVFFFPAEKFGPWYLRHLARELGGEQPFIVLGHQLAKPDEFEHFVGRFVELIRTLRPHGPMVIAGHCYGGVLAYEVGRRLIEAGETGIAVVLVNVSAPGYPKVRMGAYVGRFTWAIREIAHGRAGPLIHAAIAHVRFLREKRYAMRPATSESAGPAPNQLSPAGMLLRTYTPQPFPGRILHILGRDQIVSTEILDDPRLGWRELLSGALDEYPIEGDHHSIFDPPNASKIAAKLVGIGK